MNDIITTLSFYAPLMMIVIIVILYSLIIRKYYFLQREKFEKLTWFEEAITALSSDNPNYRPVINIMLSNARELSLLSEKKDPKIHRKITKFVNELEKTYIKSKIIDSDTFLRLYFQLIGFKNLLGDDSEHL